MSWAHHLPWLRLGPAMPPTGRDKAPGIQGRGPDLSLVKRRCVRQNLRAPTPAFALRSISRARLAKLQPVGATLVRERKLAIHGGAESHSGGLPMLLVMTRNIANTPINWAKKESKTRTRMKCHAFCSGGLSFLERTAQILQVAPACSRVHQERGKSATNAQAQLKSKARRGRALTTLQP